MTEKTIIVVRETIWESVVRDLFSFGAMGAMVGVGRLIDSTAMQWVGAFLALVFIFTKAVGTSKKHAYTLDEAAEKINAMLAARETSHE